MFQGAMSNSTLFEEAADSLSTFNPLLLQNTTILSPPQPPPPPKKVKKKRSLPGNPDADAEVIALSPKSLLATNRFICEICNKGFQRDQNLQLHRRGHNLPWKLKQRNKDVIVRKKAYVCPEPTCVHHHPSRALGDLTGIKKHFCRKHGEKKYKCEKCSKIYAVQSDWKAHSKTCGTREYRCDCGTLFSRKDSFVTHRAFCDALAEESARLSTNPILPPPQPPFSSSQNPNSHLFPFSSPWGPPTQNPNPNPNPNNPLNIQIKTENHRHFSSPPPPFTFQQPPPSFTATDTAHFLSATALLQKATTMGVVIGPQQTQTQTQDQAAFMMEAMMGGPHSPSTLASIAAATWNNKNKVDGFTRDFLGLAAGDHYHQSGEEGDHQVVDMGHMIKFTGGLQYSVTAHYDGDNSSSSSSVLLMKPDHHQEVDDHDQAFGTFVSTSSLESRWG